MISMFSFFFFAYWCRWRQLSPEERGPARKSSWFQIWWHSHKTRPIQQPNSAPSLPRLWGGWLTKIQAVRLPSGNRTESLIGWVRPSATFPTLSSPVPALCGIAFVETVVPHDMAWHVFTPCFLRPSLHFGRRAHYFSDLSLHHFIHSSWDRA